MVVIGAQDMITGEHKDLVRIIKHWWQTKNISPHQLVMNNNSVAGIYFHINKNDQYYMIIIKK